MPCGAQPRHDPSDVGDLIDGAELVQRLQAFGGEQGAQLGDLHASSLGGGQFVRLALALRECQRSA